MLITENRKLRKAHQNVSNEIIQLMNIDLLRSKGDWEIKINELKAESVDGRRRASLGAVGDRAVLGDAELPAARDQPGVRRHDAPVRVPRKRRVGVDGFGGDRRVHG